MPALADLALRAGDLLAVVVDAEVVAGVALLDAVLAGAVAGQWPGEGDLVLAAGPFHVDQGGVAAWLSPGSRRAPTPTSCAPTWTSTCRNSTATTISTGPSARCCTSTSISAANTPTGSLRPADCGTSRP